MKSVVKNSFVSFFTLFLILFAGRPGSSYGAIPPKVKAMLTICGYGAGGGAMLGMATMAFGTSSRAIAQGASLGLYAGIIFGTYVLVSHNQRRSGSYDDNASPYQNSSDVYGDEYQGDEGGSSDGAGDEGFNRIEGPQDKFHPEAFSLGKRSRGGGLPPLYINLIQLNF